MKYCVVIPTYQRVAMLQANWASHMIEHDIIIVCRSSEADEIRRDPWRAVIELPDDSPDGAGLPRAHGNLAARELGYDVIIQTDDDTKLISANLDGLARIIYKNNWLVGSKQHYDFGVDPPEFIDHRGMVELWGYRADLIDRIGNIDESFTICEDKEFQYRALQAKIRVCSWTKLKTQHRRGLPGGMPQHFYDDRNTEVKLWEAKYPGLTQVSRKPDGSIARLSFKKNYVLPSA